MAHQHLSNEWLNNCLFPECLMSWFSNVKYPIQGSSIIEKQVTLTVFGVAWKFLSQKVKANKTGLLLEGIHGHLPHTRRCYIYSLIFLFQWSFRFLEEGLMPHSLPRTVNESWHRACPVISAQRQADPLSDSITRKDFKNLNFKKETEKPSRALKTACQMTSLEKHMGVGAWMTSTSFIMEKTKLYPKYKEQFMCRKGTLWSPSPLRWRWQRGDGLIKCSDTWVLKNCNDKPTFW